MTRPTLYIIVPVLNEAENLPRLFADFKRAALDFGATYRVNIVLVDDGSSDGTPDLAASLAEELALTVLRHEVNQGPGRAFGTAFTHLAPLLTSEDWVLTIEGDNTSRQELLRQMFTRSKEGFEVIFASVYQYGGRIVNTSTYRMILSNIANTFVKEFLGIHGLLTVSSFFRLHRASVIQRLQAVYGAAILERAGFECMVEMTMKLAYLGVSISEVPMVLDTHQRKGRSKMRIARTIRGYLMLARYKNGWKGKAVSSQSSVVSPQW
jgi:dolichol-phosphate mannosyltransferase